MDDSSPASSTWSAARSSLAATRRRRAARRRRHARRRTTGAIPGGVRPHDHRRRRRPGPGGASSSPVGVVEQPAAVPRRRAPGAARLTSWRGRRVRSRPARRRKGVMRWPVAPVDRPCCPGARLRADLRAGRRRRAVHHHAQRRRRPPHAVARQRARLRRPPSIPAGTGLLRRRPEPRHRRRAALDWPGWSGTARATRRLRLVTPAQSIPPPARSARRAHVPVPPGLGAAALRPARQAGGVRVPPGDGAAPGSRTPSTCRRPRAGGRRGTPYLYRVGDAHGARTSASFPTSTRRCSSPPRPAARSGSAGSTRRGATTACSCASGASRRAPRPSSRARSP